MDRSRRRSTAVTKRAAEDRGLYEHRTASPRAQHVDDRLPAIAVALVAARGRDAAAEDERPVRVVQEDLARRRRAEAGGLDAVVVLRDVHARDRGRMPPEGGLVPRG